MQPKTCKVAILFFKISLGVCTCVHVSQHVCRSQNFPPVLVPSRWSFWVSNSSFQACVACSFAYWAISLAQDDLFKKNGHPHLLADKALFSLTTLTLLLLFWASSWNSRARLIMKEQGLLSDPRTPPPFQGWGLTMWLRLKLLTQVDLSLQSCPLHVTRSVSQRQCCCCYFCFFW